MQANNRTRLGRLWQMDTKIWILSILFQNSMHRLARLSQKFDGKKG